MMHSVLARTSVRALGSSVCRLLTPRGTSCAWRFLLWRPWRERLTGLLAPERPQGADLAQRRVLVYALRKTKA